jgi:molybdopterin-guanine dinucleotide biosynthesis protein A
MFSVVIQAGGNSRRMGSNKALLPLRGRPLIEWVLKRVQRLSDELLIITNQPEELLFLGVRLFTDLMPGAGVLGGLYTALSCAQYELVAVVACDMPFVNVKILEAQRALLISNETLDVVMPQTAGGLEPLHAVYRRRTCLPAVQTALLSGQRRMISWLPFVNVRLFQPSDWLPYDPNGEAFFNLNTPEDFERAMQLLE